MRRSWLALVLLSLTLFPGSASAYLPGWVEDEIAASSEWPRTPGVPATLLLESWEIEFKDDETKIRVRRIMRIDFPGGVVHTFLNDGVGPARKAKNVKGWLRDPVHGEEWIDEADVYEYAPPAANGIYTDMRVLAAGFPEARPGAFVAWEYEIEDEDTSHLTQILRFPLACSARRIDVNVKCRDGWQLVHEATRPEEWVRTSGADREVLSGRDWPGIPEEALVPESLPTERQLVLACYEPESRSPGHHPDWDSVAAQLLRDFAEPSQPGPGVRERTFALTRDLETTPEKVEALSGFVQEEIRYVGIEIGKGRWVPRTAESSLYNRYADCKDKTVLLRAMLAEVGVEAAPVLVYAGPPVLSKVPTPYVFNHCILAIRADACPVREGGAEAVLGDWMLFDPTDPITPLGALPSYLAGNLVLLPVPGGGLERVGSRRWADRWRTMAATATLRSDGSVRVTFRFEESGLLGHELWRRLEWMSDEEQLLLLESFFSPVFSAPRILEAGFDFDGEVLRSRIVVDSEKVVSRNETAGAFDPYVVPFPELPVLPDRARSHPLLLGHPQVIESRVEWILPAGWIPETTGTIVDAELEGSRFICRASRKDDRAILDWSYRRADTMIDADRAEDARAFFDEIRRARETPLMFAVQP